MANEGFPNGFALIIGVGRDLPDTVNDANVLHKIGVTGGSVEKRVANAKLDSTFLMADVEVIATYELYNINRTKLENLLHRFFEPAKLNIQITDRFGNPIFPREWFLVPLFIIDEVVEKIKDSKRNIFPVVNKENKLIGIINLDDIKKEMFNVEIRTNNYANYLAMMLI